MELFHNGDSSLVGERGLVLSGGQKARINLARFMTQFSFLLLYLNLYIGEPRLYSGECSRLPSILPGSESWTEHHMWVEIVGGSYPLSGGFLSRFSGFDPSRKINTI